MSTQQDIYAAGSESRPLMLNKENYVPWLSRILRYANSRPNGKLIHNSILNGPYVRRMIPEPGDANRDVNVNKTFHEQIDDELSEKELKQIEADDQAIQTILLAYKTATSMYHGRLVFSGDANRDITVTETFHLQTDDELSDKELKQIEADDQAIPTILLGLPEDIYAAIVQPGMNMGQDRQMQMVGGNGGNQFRQYAGNPAGYNDVIGNQVIQNAVQNLRVLNVGNHNGLIGVQGNGNQN
nr:hypothetical protein [Tanacetum cinerariifolium]